MYMYFFAGAFLLIAIIFVIMFFIERNKTDKALKGAMPQASEKNDVVIVTNDKDEQRAAAESKKAKRDIIIALVCMAVCEAFILIGNYIVK